MPNVRRIKKEIAENLSMAEATSRIDWYVRCLEDVQDGRVVRGLTEAKLGYQSAMDLLTFISNRVEQRA